MKLSIRLHYFDVRYIWYIWNIFHSVVKNTVLIIHQASVEYSASILTCIILWGQTGGTCSPLVTLGLVSYESIILWQPLISHFESIWWTRFCKAKAKSPNKQTKKQSNSLKGISDDPYKSSNQNHRYAGSHVHIMLWHK